ncbi:MAG: hypothetical protein FWE67_16300, partial [Planctomycetaceae bacterium]|nr:hypothetical protein [Planctomycetaceae bacterium]
MSSKQVKIKPKGGENNVTLFPFLAVLLCTMGGLIMLLIVIARNVTETNAQAINKMPEAKQYLSEAEAQHIIQQIQQEIDEADWYAENFAQSKTNAEKELADIRAELASKERQTEKVKDEIERLAKLAETLQKPQTVNRDTEQMKQILAQREKQKKELETALQKLQKEAAQDAKSYAIIPYRGQNETFRRPIYVECKNGKVIIQPEGVELHPDDFILADRPDNPLDTSLRVVRQYYVETNQIQRGTEPYPLLVVRPSGVDAYSSVRQAMGSWVNEYGYELIDEDWKMEYPPASDELRSRLEKQLESSRIRMSAYIAAIKAERLGNAMAQRQYRVDRNGVAEPVEGFHQGYSRGNNRTGNFPGNSSGGNFGSNSRMPNINPNPTPMPTPNTGPNRGGLPGSSGGNAVPSEDKYVGKIPDDFNAQQGASKSETAGYARSSIQYHFPDAAEQTADGRQQTADGQQSVLPPNFSVQPVPSGGMPAVAMSATTTPEMNMQEMPPDMAKPSGNPLFQQRQKQNENEQTRVDNWALRGMERFSTAVKRSVKIRCEKDKFVLTEQPGLIGI